MPCESLFTRIHTLPRASSNITGGSDNSATSHSTQWLGQSSMCLTFTPLFDFHVFEGLAFTRILILDPNTGEPAFPEF